MVWNRDLEIKDVQQWNRGVSIDQFCCDDENAIHRDEKMQIVTAKE